jgi:hypothetical protein
MDPATSRISEAASPPARSPHRRGDCGHRIGATRSVTRDCSVERRAKQFRLQAARSNIGLARQHAEFGGRKQNERRTTVGRYGSEYKRFYEFRIHHSTTFSVPDMSSWPSPQKKSQKNANVPVLSGTNRTFSTTPGLMSARR